MKIIAYRCQSIQSLIHMAQIWRTAIRLAVDGGHWEFVHPLIEAEAISVASPCDPPQLDNGGLLQPAVPFSGRFTYSFHESFPLAWWMYFKFYLAVLSKPNSLIVLYCFMVFSLTEVYSESF